MSNASGILTPVTQGLFGGANANQPAPTIDTSGTNAWQGNPALAGQNQQGQQAAQNLALQTAQGKGPSAAQSLLNQQTAQTQAGANALAASGSGSSGQGIARRNAMMAGSNAMQTLGGQAATARAQEQLGGESLYGNLTNTARGQDLTAAGQQAQLASNQGQLQEQQNQINAQSAQANAAANQGTFQSLAGMAAGATLFAADGDVGGARIGTSVFKEPTTADAKHAPGAPPPGQESKWIIREEPDFVLLVNARTGKKYKMGMDQLSKHEEQQVQAPHGAGPIDGSDSQRIHSQMADGDLGGDPRFAAMVRRAHPGLYKAAQYADGSLGGGLAVSMPVEPTGPEVASARKETGDPGYYGYVPFSRQPQDAGPSGNSDDAEWAEADALAAGNPDLVSGVGAPSAQPSKGGGLASVIGGALLGFSNPNALGRVAAAKYGARQNLAPIPTPSPMHTYSDGDLGDSLTNAIKAADDRIAKARQDEWARQTTDKALRGISSLRTEVLSSMDPPADDTRTLLKRRPGDDEGSVALYTSPQTGRRLEGLGWGDFQDVASPGSATGMQEGEVTERRFHDADLDEDPDSEESGTETNTAREAFDKDIVRTRHELEDDRPATRVYDVDNPLDVWDYEAGLQRQRDDARDLSWMEQNNPYLPSADSPGQQGDPLDVDDPEQVAEYERSHPQRPAFAALFSVPKSEAGPTDFMSALHARNQAYDRSGGLPQAARDFEHDTVEDTRHEDQLSRLGLDLVPGEAETISLEEARKRTKSRYAIRALMKKWAEESRTPRPPRPEDETEEEVASYPDADLGEKPRKGRALGKLMKTQKRKTKAA